LVTVFSNQAAITLKSDSKTAKSDLKRLTDFKAKIGFVLGQLDIPITIYAATTKDKYRKPRLGMWMELLDDYDLDVSDGADLKASFFVGDAGGRLAESRLKPDHSCCDR
jgi:bifunctional polynucleotide phosphatase/kinase